VSAVADTGLQPRSIERVLVANRGEIARRIMRTCRRLGIETVAVHSDADANAPHAREADLGVRLPGTSATETYLCADLLIAAALRTGADAIHPGYGFLSERADFAAAVTGAGLTFIGPPASAIDAMGSKIGAKALMRAAGVPVLPDNSVESLDEVGVPALVKASAGGGGRGMRIVRTRDELDEQIAAAEREAKAAFGDGTVFVERYVEGGRHVEIQVFADLHGNVVSLFERDCTLQRRHQKIIEESPSPAVDAGIRERMSEAAIAAARAVGYVGAGTVEFLLDRDGTFSFLEMNTRLQVEHPVTEMITGLDLVELQLLVASGEPLPAEALEPTTNGHAVEVRLTAEDPGNGYRPSSGTFHHVRFADVDGVRVDSAVESGSEISPYYDSLIAKVIGHGPTREIAIRRVRAALLQSDLIGPVTNRQQLLLLLDDLTRRADEIDTGYVEREARTGATPPPAALVAAAALAAAADRRVSATVLRHVPSGWRNNPSIPQHQRLGGHDVQYRIGRDGRVAEVAVDGESLPPELVADSGAAPQIVNGVAYVRRGMWSLPIEERFTLPDLAGLEGSLVAPMPGSVVRVAVSAGDVVAAGDVVVVIEAMKMEHQIVAPAAGTVAEVFVGSGQQLDTGQPLLRLDAATEDEG
jgi:propionyl-CoA carboxylase alpha chain